MCAVLRKIVESSSVQRSIKKLPPETKKGYSKAIEALKSGGNNKTSKKDSNKQNKGKAKNKLKPDPNAKRGSYYVKM